MEELASGELQDNNSIESAVNSDEQISSPTLSTNTSKVRSKESLEINDTEVRDISTSDGKRRLSDIDIATRDSNEASTSKKSKYKKDENEVNDAAAVESSSQQKDESQVSSNATADVEFPQEKDAEDEANLDHGEPLASSAELDSECQQSGSGSSVEKDSSMPVTNAAVKVKTEPIDASISAHSSTTTGADIKPTLNIKKEEATSTSRESCKFGIRCYRRNPMHRIDEAHPGDHDYKRPKYPLPPLGTPHCPYGDACYRRNPVHFQQFTHPPQTDFKQNWKNYCSRLLQRIRRNLNGVTDNSDVAGGSASDLDDYDLEDPFQGDDDADEDFIPSTDELKNASADESDEDECDKAEE